MTIARHPAMFALMSGHGALVFTMMAVSFGPPPFANRIAYSPCQLSNALSFMSTIGLRSSTGSSPCGTVEPRSRVSMQPIAVTATTSAVTPRTELRPGDEPFMG